MKYIRSILFNLFYFIWTFCLSFIGCLTAPLPRKAIMGIAKFWSVTTMKAMEVLIGLKYRVEGIENLPENQKTVIKMRFYQGLSFKEISAVTGVSINTALGRMRYALFNMRRMATEQGLTLLS